jgi:subtilisin family serine protease
VRRKKRSGRARHPKVKVSKRKRPGIGASGTPSGGSPPPADGARKAKPDPFGKLTLRVATLSEAFLADAAERERLGMPITNDGPMPVVVEMNLLHLGGLTASIEKFRKIFRELFPGLREPLLLADTYCRCSLSVNQVRKLIARDQQDTGTRERSIYRVWPDFKMKVLIDRSVSTVKADAARRSYDASGAEIVWGVIDSGIDERHPHFAQFDTVGGEVRHLHRDFTGDGGPVPGGALIDDLGHGTHVAGILAGGLEEQGLQRRPPATVCVGQRVSAARDQSDPLDEAESIQERTVEIRAKLSGVAPRCKLVSLKVVGPDGDVRSTDVIRALEYVRKSVNGHGKPPLRIHGVNLSLGYDFNARWFACGQSPICVEVDRLVRSGVVVVIAAGNTGYGRLAASVGETSTGLSLTINDPGNAELAITVGSTHRDSPHTYGVSFFSSKGPTGDGRLKPDLVAPGERITSCAAGAYLRELERACVEDWRKPWPRDAAPYIDSSGTSMAAPHVSGAIAAFLSIRREFIGRPEDVKRIFLQTATSLGRERYFEGRGIVDLMRAISAV